MKGGTRFSRVGIFCERVMRGLIVGLSRDEKIYGSIERIDQLIVGRVLEFGLL